MIKLHLIFLILFQLLFPIGLINARGMVDKILAPDYLNYNQIQKIHWVDQFGHYESVNAVAISRDGKYMVSGDYNGLIILWHLASGKIIGRFQSGASISGLAFSQDGLHILSRDGNNLCLWSLDGWLIKTLGIKQEDIYNISLTPYGKYIMLEDLNNNITLLHSDTLEVVKTVPPFAEDEEYVALSPFGTFVVGKKSDTSIALWNLNHKTLLTRIENPTPAFKQIKVSTQGILATRGQGSSVYLWNTAGNLIRELKDHQYNVTNLFFSADGQYLATVMGDIIKVWQVATGWLVQELTMPDWYVNAITFSSDNKIMAIATGSNILYWDMKSKKELTRLKNQSYFVHRALFTTEDKYLLVGYSKYFFEGGGQCNLFSTEQPEVLDFKVPGLHNITDVALSADGTFLASAGSFGRDPRFIGELMLWSDKGTSQIIKVPYTDWLYRVEITTDSQYLVTIGDDSQIKLWNRDGQLVRVFQVGERTYEMDISPLHNHIAGITDQGLTIWNFNGAVFKTLTAGGMFRFAPEQSLIAVQENKNKLILYDYEQDTIMHEFIYQQADGDIVSFSFSTDGKYLVLLYGAVEWEVKAHKIDVVDTQTGEKVNTIQFSPDKGIIKVELGIDNNFLIIITNEHALQILNLSTEKSLYITNFDDGHWVVYDEDYHFDCSPNGGQHVGLIKGINPLPSAEYDAFYRPGLFNQFLRGE